LNTRNSLLWLGMFSILNLEPAYPQNEGDELSIASYRKTYSEVLGEERTVAVSLPVSYESSGKRYPVLYMLDAEDSDFAGSVGIVRFLSRYRIPEMIVVGVVNTVRNRDLWAEKIQGLALTTDGGADNFLEYFSDELIPFIDENYRTTAHRAIFGGSAGGHFVTYALLKNPGLFEDYLASSPVIGFSENRLLTEAETVFSRQKSLNKRYFIYYGKTDYNSVIQRIPVLESIIRTHNPDGFTWGIKPVEGRHVPPESLYELLMMLYPDWQPVRPPVITPSPGEFLRGGSISVSISGIDDPVHFTLDGQEPSRRSPVWDGPISIGKSTTLKARAIRGDLQESGTVSASFTPVDAPRPARSVTNLKSGLTYAYIEEQLFLDPDSISSPPAKAGVVPSIDLSVRERDQFYVLQFDGFIKIPSDGPYRFYIVSNRSKCFLDGALFTSNHNLSPQEKVREICLASGYHSIRIVSYVLTHMEHVLQLYWEGQGLDKQEIPPSAFYH